MKACLRQVVFEVKGSIMLPDLFIPLKQGYNEDRVPQKIQEVFNTECTRIGGDQWFFIPQYHSDCLQIPDTDASADI
jgi:hypothetical protein